jgi:hypothetical protein
VTCPPAKVPRSSSRCPSVCSTRIGGLTVLHQCLVTMPNEDFVYFGDTARFPYGEKSQEQLQEYATQIATFLERVGVKLLVAACYSATAAALPTLQERFATPILGVVMPGARAAVQTSRYRRIGILATEATVASGSYPRAIASLDIGAEVHQRAVPACLVHPGRRCRQPRWSTRRAVHGAAGRRRRCGHHGLHALPLISPCCSAFGPDVRSSTRAEVARGVRDPAAAGHRAARGARGRVLLSAPVTRVVPQRGPRFAAPIDECGGARRRARADGRRRARRAIP